MLKLYHLKTNLDAISDAVNVGDNYVFLSPNIDVTDAIISAENEEEARKLFKRYLENHPVSDDIAAYCMDATYVSCQRIWLHPARILLTQEGTSECEN